MHHIDVVRLAALRVGASLAATACAGIGDQTSTVSPGPAAGVSNSPSGGARTAATPMAARASLTGAWSGTWQRTSQTPGRGTYTCSVTQLGVTIAGTIFAQSSACLTKRRLTGTMSGDTVLFYVSDNGVTADCISKATAC